MLKPNQPTVRQHLWKRPFDLALALPLAMIATPVILAMAVVSAIVYRAWPFFTQERIGRDGKTFRFVKVRSLPRHVNRYTDKYSLVTVPNSPWGKVIRRTHLDELPQLWIVVRGHMSLVGPRPEMAVLVEKMHPVVAHRRHSVRPGCTGPWQLSDRCTGLISEAPEFDDHYIKTASLLGDVRLLLLTVLSVTPWARPFELPASVGRVQQSEVISAVERRSA